MSSTEPTYEVRLTSSWDHVFQRVKVARLDKPIVFSKWKGDPVNVHHITIVDLSTGCCLLWTPSKPMVVKRGKSLTLSIEVGEILE